MLCWHLPKDRELGFGLQFFILLGVELWYGLDMVLGPVLKLGIWLL